MAVNIEDVRKILSGVRQELMKKPNVVATGVGYKTVKGRQTDELAIICSVNTKTAQALLAAKDIIPAMIQDVPTDVFPTGVISALATRREKVRPAPGGVSVGHINITAGTLGCLVKKNDTLFILSNNHVLANSNDAHIGDTILQPGPADGGQDPQDHIANLSAFVPIEFEGEDNTCSMTRMAAYVINALAFLIGSKTRLQNIRKQASDNLVDCAIAEVLNPGDVTNEILEIGTIANLGEASLNMEIQKSGRTSEYTRGKIIQIDVTSRVSYGPNKVATFVDQLMAGNMSQPGDSGSAVLGMDNKLVGLLFAGSDTSTIINPIQFVFQELNISLP